MCTSCMYTNTYIITLKLGILNNNTKAELIGTGNSSLKLIYDNELDRI